jgi:hypothetical protein
MRTSHVILSILAGLMVGHGLLAQGTRKAKQTPPGDRRGGSSTESVDRVRPMREQTQKTEGSPRNREGAELSPMGRPHRRPGAVVAESRFTTRCTVIPNLHFWKQRDIMEEIQWMSRRGSIPVTPVAEDVAELNDAAMFPSGLKAYGFVVPAGGKLHVRLNHGNLGWFRVAMVNKWGDLGAGMLQNLIPTGNPEVRYTNPTKEAQGVYVIVDDPGWMSSAAYPYTLQVQRDWEPGRADTQGFKLAQGIWMSNPATAMNAEFGAHHSRAGFGVGMRW